MTVENEWLRLTRKGDDKEMAAVMAMIRTGDHMSVRRYLRDGGDANARNHLGYTLLHVACMEGKANVVEVLLDGGASVNSCTIDQTTPLHRAASHGHKIVVELLLDKNAYINAQDKKGDTPLHLAAQSLQTAVAKLLMTRKADKTRENLRKQIFTDVIGQQMMPVIERGDTETLLPWIEMGVSPNCRGAMNWSMLHHAAAREQLNCASIIIEKKGDVNILDSNNATPLHTACFHGNIKGVKLLIASGANVNAQDQSGKTPLLSAVSGNSHQCINLLLEKGGDPDIPDNEGNHFTHLVNEFLVRAVHNSNVNQVHGVLRARGDPNVRDSSGLPVLCYAAFKGSLMIADALLEYGADANIKDKEYGKTPLHWAAYWGQLFILKSLLDKGASVKMKDDHGRIPLHEGALEGHEDIITVLSARFSPINDQDNEGNTPLHLAAKWGKHAQVEQLLELGAREIQNINSLLYSDLSLIRAVRTGDKAAVISGLAWGGNSNTQDAKGCTLLHHAILRDMDDIADLLLRNRADVNIRDKHGRNALLLAAYKGNHMIMEELTNAGVDLNAQDWSGSTPLHWAANEGTIDTVEFLIKHNADRTIKNKKDQLYTDLLLKHLYFAVRRNDLDSVIKMLEAGADQHAIVFGTELTPKEEACRQQHWAVLQYMGKVGPPKEPKPEDPNTMLAIQDVYRLFEDSGRSEEDSGVDDDTDAYWKMSNASRVHSYAEVFQDEDPDWTAWQEKPISAKDLFKEETAAFWKDLEEDLKQRLEEEKANAISAQEFFKDDKPWWEKNGDDEDDDEDDNEDGSEEADDEDDESDDENQRQLLKENAIPAKDIFKDEHPFFKEEIISKEEIMKNDTPWWKNDKDEQEKDKIISKEEIMKTNTCWWENSDDNNDQIENNEKLSETISKEEIMKSEAPWWIKNKNVDVITKEEYNKDNKDWWATKNDSEEAKEQQHWQKNKQENTLLAKKILEEKHPWFANKDVNDAKEKEKVISLQEYLKDENSSWWDARNSPPKDESIVGNLKKSSLDVSYNDITANDEDSSAISKKLQNNDLVNKTISAKEFFKEDDRPWWYNNNSENGEKLNQRNGFEDVNNEVKEENSNDNEDQSSEDEETSSENEKDKSADENHSTKDNEEKSVDDDIEESRTDTWEDANDSVFSETSTMYSISDGDQRLSQPWWEEKKAWWEDSSDTTDSTPRQEVDSCEVIGENKTDNATSDDTNIEPNTITSSSENQNINENKSHFSTEAMQTNEDKIHTTINCDNEQELEVHSEDEIDDICDEEVEEAESDSGCISTTFEPISLINEGVNEGLVEKLNAKINLETIKENNEIQTEITTKTNINSQRNNNEDINKHEQNKVTDARGIETLQDLTSKVVTEMVSKDPILEKNDNIDVDVTNSDPYLLLDPSKLLEMGLQKSDSQTSGYESSLSLSTTDTNKSNNRNNNSIKNSFNDSNVKTYLTQEIASSTKENPKPHPTLLITQETPEIKTQEGTTKLSVHLHDPQPSETHLSPQADIDDVKAFVADYEVSDAAKLAEKLVEQMESIIKTNQEVNKSIEFIDTDSPNDQMINSEYNESLKKLVPEVLHENVITGDKIINKMDNCLAKVDASLAWIDEKLMKENSTSKRISTSKECLYEELDKSTIAPETVIIQNISNQDSPDKKVKKIDPVFISRETSASNTKCELSSPKSDTEEFVFHEEIPVRTFQSPRLPRKNKQTVKSKKSKSNLKPSKKIPNILSNQEVKQMNMPGISSESLSPKSDEEFIFHEVIPVRTFQSPRLSRKKENAVKTKEEKNNNPLLQKTKKDEKLSDGKDVIEDNISKNSDNKVSSLKNETENINEKTVNYNNIDHSKTEHLKEIPKVSESYSKINVLKKTEDIQSGEELSSNTYKSKDGSLESILIIPDEKSSQKGSIESLNSSSTNLSNQLLIPDQTLWRCSTYDTMSLSDYDNMIYSFGKSTSLSLSDSEESLKGSRISLINLSTGGNPNPQHKEEYSEKTHLHMDERVSQNCSDVPQSPKSQVCHDSVNNLCTDPIVEAVGSGSQNIKESSTNDEPSLLKDSVTKSDNEPDCKKSDSICKSSVREKVSLMNKNKDQNKDVTSKITTKKAANNQRNVGADFQESKHKDIKLDKGTGTVPKKETKSCDEAQPSSSQFTADLDKPSSVVLDQKRTSQSPPTNNKTTSQNSQPPVVPQRTRGSKEKSQSLDREIADQYTVHTQNAQSQHTNIPLLYNPDKSEDVKVGQLPPRSGEPQLSRGSTRNEKQDKQTSKELKAASGKNDSARKSSSCRVS